MSSDIRKFSLALLSELEKKFSNLYNFTNLKPSKDCMITLWKIDENCKLDFPNLLSFSRKKGNKINKSML